MELVNYLEEFLSLPPCFSISHIQRDEKSLEAHIYLTYADTNLPADLVVHSYYERTWEHLSFFQYRCFFHCDLPIYRHKTTHQLSKPEITFARENSRFTLLYEANVMYLLQLSCSFTQVARQLKINIQRVAHLYHYYTKDLEIDHFDTCPVRIAYDETSTRKGHHYITTFYYLDTKRIIGIYESKSAQCVKQFYQDHPYPEAIKHISMDMSPAFISGATTFFPQANITFDKWHVIKLLVKHLEKLEKKAHCFIENIQLMMETMTHFYTLKSKEEASALLAFMADFAAEKMGKNAFTNTINNHFEGICNYFNSKISNGVLEGINSKIQVIKRIARGFRYVKNFIKMIRFAFN